MNSGLLRKYVCSPVEGSLSSITIVIHTLLGEFKLQGCAVKGILETHGVGAAILIIRFFNIEIAVHTVCAAPQSIGTIKDSPGTILIELIPFPYFAFGVQKLPSGKSGFIR
jgi:hypothetical protein